MQVALPIITVIMIDFLNAVGFYLTVIFLPLYFQDFVGLSRRVVLGKVGIATAGLCGAQPQSGGWGKVKGGTAGEGQGTCKGLAACPLVVIFLPLYFQDFVGLSRRVVLQGG